MTSSGIPLCPPLYKTLFDKYFRKVLNIFKLVTNIKINRNERFTYMAKSLAWHVSKRMLLHFIDAHTNVLSLVCLLYESPSDFWSRI